MALTSTTWDASSAGPFATLSPDLLTVSGPAYEDASVRSVSGVNTGKFYWELTFVAFESPSGAYVGVSSPGTSMSVGAVLVGLLESLVVDQGDVVGFALDVDGETLAMTRNGSALTTLSGVVRADSGEPWYAAIPHTGFYGMSGEVRANFGATAFAYTVPSGYEAGFGTDGSATVAPMPGPLGLGAPFIDGYPPVVQGQDAPLGLGEPRLVTKTQVFGIQVMAPLGEVTLRSDITVAVQGIRAVGLGGPNYVPTVVQPGPIFATVAGVESTGQGAVQFSGSLLVPVEGVQAQGLGEPRAGVAYPVAGIESGGLGDVGHGVRGRVSGIAAAGLGPVAARFGSAVAGLQARGLGPVHCAWGAVLVEVDGIEALGLGDVGPVLRKFPVRPQRAPVGLGVPQLGGLTC